MTPVHQRCGECVGPMPAHRAHFSDQYIMIPMKVLEPVIIEEKELIDHLQHKWQHGHSMRPPIQAPRHEELY